MTLFTKSSWLLAAALGVVCSPLCQPILAQGAEPSEAISGYRGQIQIMPNADRKEVTVALNSDILLAPTSRQIVFHIQDSTSSVPKAWSGHGRVLASKNLVAVIPDNEQKGWLFKFPDAAPLSISKTSFDQYTAFGIARYGEHRPLTTEQIERLAKTGKTAAGT